MDKRTTKQLLIIEASDDVCSAEIVNIKAAATLNGLQPHHFQINSFQELKTYLSKDIRYDYIYLCAHANRHSFGTKNGSLIIAWEEFATLVCKTGCIKDNAIFLLACCRSGINQVAYDMFYNCEFIDFVCGPTWTVTPQALTLAFNVFLFQVEFKGNEPTEAAERMNAATGNNFVFFDRIRTETEISYIRHIEAIEAIESKKAGEVTEINVESIQAA